MPLYLIRGDLPFDVAVVCAPHITAATINNPFPEKSVEEIVQTDDYRKLVVLDNRHLGAKDSPGVLDVYIDGDSFECIEFTPGV